jgi:methionine-gamma-lyase
MSPRHDDDWKLETRAIHAADDHNPGPGLVPPLVQSSTFRLESTEQGARYTQSRAPEALYTRWGNPTTRHLEILLADMEGGERALAFSSGLGAISSAVFARLRPGDHAVFGDSLYAATHEIVDSLFPLHGIDCDRVDSTRTDELKAAVRPSTRLIYVETPSNPTLGITDLREVAALGRKTGALTMVDSTFAGPANQRPLALGVDVVVHSMTKHLNGHSDVTAGVVVGRRDFVEDCWSRLKLFGACPSPFESWLLIRGLKTYPLRMARHNENALEIARYLEGHPAVEKVHYPGLESHPHHGRAASQMAGFGGMVSVELKGGLEAGRRFCESLRLLTLAVSLGGAESLVTHPASTTHGTVSEESRRKGGIPDGLIRISVGLEHIDDLLADVTRALEA